MFRTHKKRQILFYRFLDGAGGEDENWVHCENCIRKGNNFLKTI